MLKDLKKRVKRILIKLKYGKTINYPEHLFIHPHVGLNQVEFEEYCQVAHHAEINNAKIGRRTSVGRYTKIQTADIGRYCSISWGCTIGATSHPYSHLSSHAFSYRKMFGLVEEDSHYPKHPVTIGHDVWIGCDAIIMPGIKIGHGAVIGAGSVVTKDVDAYGIYVGNPAKKIKQRFSPEMIDDLLALEWWNWSDKEIKANMNYFSHDLNQEALSQLKEKNNV